MEGRYVHFVNGCGFGHEEESFALVTSGENVDGFEGHFFETGLIKCCGLVAGWGEGLVEVVFVDLNIVSISQLDDLVGSHSRNLHFGPTI